MNNNYCAILVGINSSEILVLLIHLQMNTH